jgi:hypothetical protein
MTKPPSEDPKAGELPPENPRVGLCARCRHARRIVSAKGSEFYMCLLAATDSRFRKYPPLPVRSCSGHEPGTPSGR